LELAEKWRRIDSVSYEKKELRFGDPKQVMAVMADSETV